MWIRGGVIMSDPADDCNTGHIAAFALGASMVLLCAWLEGVKGMELLSKLTRKGLER